ncbi:MAG: nitroreductase [Marinobacterium sp.]|nr:nitroreductase [Marinobacterium sp.]
MDAIEALLSRASMPLLEAPGPGQPQLDLMFSAALRAPDHGALRPFRFLVIEGEAREQLGQLYLEAALQDDPELPEEKRQKTLKMPLRAPTMVVVIAVTKAGHKVPVLEQQITAGCAAQNMLHAAYAQGVGAMWRTGAMAYHPHVLKGLGLADNEEVIGYLYLGTPCKERKVAPLPVERFVSQWTGQ